MSFAAVDPTTLRVTSEFTVRRRIRGLGSIRQQLRNVTRDAVRARSQIASITGGFTGGGVFGAFGRLAGGLFGGVAGGIAGGLLAQGVIGLGRLVTRAGSGIASLNSEMEDLQLNITGVLTSLTRLDPARSFELARDQVAGLRREAARLPGELPEFVLGFQTILGATLSAGRGVEEARRLNRLAIVAGSIFGAGGTRGRRTFPLDIQQALTQGLGAQRTRDLNVLVRGAGVTLSQFNRQTRGQRFDTLIRALERIEGVTELIGQSFSAQSATFRDNIREIGRNASRPIFQVWTRQLNRINRFFQQNEGQIRRLSRLVGVTLRDGYQFLARIVQRILPDRTSLRLFEQLGILVRISTDNVVGLVSEIFQLTPLAEILNRTSGNSILGGLIRVAGGFAIVIDNIREFTRQFRLSFNQIGRNFQTLFDPESQLTLSQRLARIRRENFEFDQRLGPIFTDRRVRARIRGLLAEITDPLDEGGDFDIPTNNVNIGVLNLRVEVRNADNPDLVERNFVEVLSDVVTETRGPRRARLRPRLQ